MKGNIKLFRRIEPQKGVVAALAVILLFFVTSFSFYYIAYESEHDCCGRDCPVCAHIDRCQQMLRNTEEGSACMAIAAIFFVLIQTTKAVCSVCVSNSPVLHKVRLNN